MIIELHAIQTFGPSNLNRDDTGNPKEALFGGVRRARISSQSGKRAMRTSEVFRRAIQVPTGTRTKSLIEQVANRLIEANFPEDTAVKTATDTISSVFASTDKKNAAKTNVLVYISNDEFNGLVEAIVEAEQQGKTIDPKAIIKRLKDRSLAPDIALFGRMLAEHPEVSVDAACQMAHALSTHEVNSAEFDYFTAVDDLTPNEETGAGMLGLVAFNSATYYRCVRIDWEQLVTNLHGDTALAAVTVSALMQAFALVVPTGMKNSFVNQHAPDFLMAVVRHDNDGQSLDNAFEKPVLARRGSGYAQPSVEALATYWDQVDVAFRLSDPVVSVMNPRQYPLSSTELANATQPNLRSWIEVIINELSREHAR